VSKKVDAKPVPRRTQTSFAGVERAVCVVEESTCPQVSPNTLFRYREGSRDPSWQGRISHGRERTGILIDDEASQLLQLRIHVGVSLIMNL
jgi:hypothetical protein